MIYQKKMAVVLCGSGFADGSEIRESVLTLLALSQHGIAADCYSIKDNQAVVMNCLTNTPMLGQTRAMDVESARIARGQIYDLATFKHEDYAALIIPGGFGVARNLSTFITDGLSAHVRNEVRQAIVAMHTAKKPIGAVCIAPILIALTLRNQSITLTLGPQAEDVQKLTQLGHTGVQVTAKEAITDEAHKIVTTPAYMDDSPSLSDIFTGINAMVKELARLAQ